MPVDRPIRSGRVEFDRAPARSPENLTTCISGVWLGAILLKDPVATKSFIPIFLCNGKHFLDINSMIDCHFIENHQRRYAVETGTQPNHYFLWKFSSVLNATFLIDTSTIYCPHSIVLRIIDIINVKKFLIRKENSHSVLFSKICSIPICKFFPFDLLIIGKQYFDSFFIIRQTLLSEIPSPIDSFRADALFFGRERCFTF